MAFQSFPSIERIKLLHPVHVAGGAEVLVDLLQGVPVGVAVGGGEAEDDAGAPPKTVKPGDSVKIVSLDQKATVLSPADAKGDVQVQAGIMKLSVKLSDLRLVQEEQPKQGKAQFAAAMERRVGLELDIRGMLVNEALSVVDRYLDDAYLSGLSEVNIIHGKGTGALRTGVQDFLKRHPRVKGFRIGNYGEGDAGVTVVTLKK